DLAASNMAHFAVQVVMQRGGDDEPAFSNPVLRALRSLALGSFGTVFQPSNVGINTLLAIVVIHSKGVPVSSSPASIRNTRFPHEVLVSSLEHLGRGFSHSAHN